MTRSRLNVILFTLAVCLFTTAAFAQPSTTTEQSTLQNTETKAKYPTKPKDMTEFGIHLGHAFIAGDVTPAPGYGIGLHVRKSLGYLVSLRGNFTYSSYYGNDDVSNFKNIIYRPITDRITATTGPAIPAKGTPWVYNYNTTSQQIDLDVVFNLNNINFHKSTTDWGWYAYAGGGIYLQQRAKLRNYLGDNGTTANFSNDRPFKARTTWISNAELAMEYHVGGGVTRKLSDKSSISLDNKIMFWTFTDRMDGSTGGQFADMPIYTSVRLNLNIGDPAQQSQPLWWVNPLDAPYEAIANNTEELNKLGNILADADGDGVPDKLDKEMNSPAGAIVDTRGVTLDSDGDGTPDYQDEDPFGIDPKLPKTMTPEDIKNIGKAEGWYEKPDAGKYGTGVTDWFLPMIHFDLNKSTIKSQYYGQLHHVATVMQKYPSLNVVVTGHASTDGSVARNQTLAENRAKAVVDFLTKNYGISSGRFSIEYKGEAQPLPGAAGTNFMNRRVEFRVAN